MRPARFDGHDISEAWEMEEGTPLRFRSSWLRGVDLNHRPLGYEPRTLVISTTYKARVALEKPCKMR